MARNGVLTALGMFTPLDAERDPSFRRDVYRRARIGMIASGLLALVGPLAVLLAQLVLHMWRFTTTLDGSAQTVAIWIPLTAIAVALMLLWLGFTSWGPRHGRLITGVVVIIMTLVVPLDFIAAGQHHPSKWGIQALVLLIAVGTMPYRGWHMLILGFAVTVASGLEALIVPGLFGHNPLDIIPELPVYMGILTLICAGISALVYQARYRHHIAHDEEQAMQERIVESERKYRSLFENSADGIFVYSDDKGGFVMVNRVVEEVTGYSAGELAQMHFSQIIHPEDRERVVQIHAARLKGEHAPTRYTLKLQRKGEAEPVICDMTIHSADDPRHTTGSIRDVTAQIKMEEENAQLAKLPETNPFPVLRYDYEGRLEYMNPAARRFPREIGHPEVEIFDILPDGLPEQIKRLIDTDTTILDSRHDALDRTFLVTYRPMSESRKIFIWMVDVTERIRAEEKIRAYATQLEEANRDLREMQTQLVQSEKMAALGNLVAGVAHEINTPVGSIHANADVSRRALEIIRNAHNDGCCTIAAEIETKYNEAIKILEESNATTRTATERIVGIVRSLRNFARLDEAELKEVDIHEGLESTLTLAYHEYKNRVEIVRDFAELPPVRCFPNQINQVFMNILVNAVHAIQGKGTITLTTRPAGKNVKVAFTDTGKGIAPENLDRIFDPGFTTKGVGVGTGLGLSIVYKIIAAHGGTVDVVSKVGEGTTFTITLPISPTIGDDREAATPV